MPPERDQVNEGIGWAAVQHLGCAGVGVGQGHEDLRQDERVMQLFGLVNNMLSADRITAERGLSIARYAVIPLSPNSGAVSCSHVRVSHLSEVVIPVGPQLAAPTCPLWPSLQVRDWEKTVGWVGDRSEALIGASDGTLQQMGGALHHVGPYDGRLD